MEDDIQEEMLKLLKNIDTNFNLYLSLFKLVNEDKIEEMKKELFNNKNIKQIYDLCDEKTPQEIEKETGILIRTVNRNLNKLTSAGLLSYKKDGKKRIYSKTLE